MAPKKGGPESDVLLAYWPTAGKPTAGKSTVGTTGRQTGREGIPLSQIKN